MQDNPIYLNKLRLPFIIVLLSLKYEIILQPYFFISIPFWF